MSFLPESYDKIPSGSTDYMKLQDGSNNFRVLSSAIVGYLYWNNNNKPVRAPQRWDHIPADCKAEDDGTFKISHFWAFAVWNYDLKRVQILEVTQKQVMTQMKALADNQRWGDPKNFDITIDRSGNKFDTKYAVMANPPIAPAAPEILEAFAKRPVNLAAMFAGGDPFQVSAPATAAPAQQTPAAAPVQNGAWKQPVAEGVQTDLNGRPLDPTPIEIPAQSPAPQGAVTGEDIQY